VVASKANDSGQKVENLREAVLHASPESEVFVFVDSDARPSRDWLRNLVAPLKDPNIGAATGYRWFISKKATLASELRNIWNASIASVLGPDIRDNFCWGGSTSIRRDTFEKLDIREKWRGTLSDDFTVTRAMSAANLPIHFVPQALTASFDDCSIREMLEFTTRQMKITRVYAPKFWIMSFLGSGLFCITMLWSLGIMIFSRQNDNSVWLALATFGVVSLLSAGKSYLRLRAVRLVLNEHASDLRKQLLPQLTLWLIAPFIFYFNSVCALFSRRIKWRGITYEMVSPTETIVVRE
jgi:ceramide glucosyltransferase